MKPIVTTSSRFVCVYVCMYVCIYIYTYTYTHTLLTVFEGAEEFGRLLSQFISEVVELSHCLLATFSYPVSYPVNCPVSRDSSASISTRYGLDGPGIESRWERDFPHLSRPALGPALPPIQWVPGLYRG